MTAGVSTKSSVAKRSVTQPKASKKIASVKPLKTAATRSLIQPSGAKKAVTNAAMKSQKPVVKRSATQPKSKQDVAITREFRKAVLQKLNAWVATVPDPDQPLIGTASGKVAPLSPRSIVSHVRKRTPTGEKLVANWTSLVLKKIKATPLA
jgi:hypothetical protein